MAYELPALPYAYDALEPHIDAKTMKSTTQNTTGVYHESECGTGRY